MLAVSVGDIMIVSGLLCLLTVAILAGNRAEAATASNGPSPDVPTP
jgi:hypothetical protein